MPKHLILIVGIIIGLTALAGWRFATYESEAVHYHANFAVYINGERVAFAEPTYYEELAGCDLHEFASPHDRVHMHDGVNELVHVHASAVTWGNFFENIGWSLGPDFIRTREQLYAANEAKSLTYVLNGQPMTNPANMVIGNEDKLLISYGEVDETALRTQLASMPSSAHEQNLNPDPAGCGGSVEAIWQERLKNIFR